MDNQNTQLDVIWTKIKTIYIKKKLNKTQFFVNKGTNFFKKITSNTK